MKQLNSGAKRGNDGELKYYEMKGVKGTIVAKINQGMSSRVKTSAEYANTRLNNAEFGAAGNMAGAICKALTQRWRSITIPFATAKLLPQIKVEMGKDTTNPWGQRALVGTGWQNQLRQYINDLSKVSFDEEINSVAGTNRDTDGDVEVEFDKEVAQRVALESRGIDGVDFDMYAVKITTPAYSQDINGYTPALVEVVANSTKDYEFGDDIVESISLSGTSALADASGVLTGIVVVALPYRKIGNVKYVAQEFCCHKILAVPASSEITA